MPAGEDDPPAVGRDVRPFVDRSLGADRHLALIAAVGVADEDARLAERRRPLGCCDRLRVHQSRPISRHHRVVLDAVVAPSQLHRLSAVGAHHEDVPVIGPARSVASEEDPAIRRPAWTFRPGVRLIALRAGPTI